MSTRRYHEEGAGGRTGLRLPTIARNSSDLENVDSFLAASRKKMDDRNANRLNAHDEDDEEEEEEDYNDGDYGYDTRGQDDDLDRQSADEYASSLVDHHAAGSGGDSEEDEDALVENQIALGSRSMSGSKSRSGASASMDLENSDALSPQTAVAQARGSARKGRGSTPALLDDQAEDDEGDSTEDRARTPRAANAHSSPGTPGVPRRATAGSRMSNFSARELNFDSTVAGLSEDGFENGDKDDYNDNDDVPMFPDDQGPESPGSGIYDYGGAAAAAERSLTFSDVASPTAAAQRRNRTVRGGESDDEDEQPVRRKGRRSSGNQSSSANDSQSISRARSSNASASRSSIGGSSLNASIARRAFNNRRRSGADDEEAEERQEQSRRRSPSRSSVSQPSPAKSAISSVSSAGGRALDFGDGGGDGFDYGDQGGYDGPDFNANEDNDDDAGRGYDDLGRDSMLVDEDVGEEALNGTSAGRSERQLAKDRAEEAKNEKKLAAAQKKKDAKGKRRARSEDRESEGRGPAIQIDKHTVQRSRTPNGKYQQVEIVEQIPDSFHLQGMGDPDQTIEQLGPRRGKRLRYAPLEWWRGERAVFGRAQLSTVPEGDEDDSEDEDEDEFEARPRRQELRLPVPVLKQVVRIPRAPGEGTFTGMKMKKGSAGRKKYGAKDALSHSKKRGKSADSEDEEEEDVNHPSRFNERGYTRQPEDGWDAETEQMGIVWDVDTGEETTRRIACQRDEVKTKKVFNSEFRFDKVFGVDDFMAAGVIEIPAGGSKPVKPSKTNSYTFIVSEGAVRVRIHRSNFVVGPGGMFLVPKGNTYSIENVAKRQSRLFFAQARDPNLDPDQARGAAAVMVGSQSAAGPSGSQDAAAAAAPAGATAKGRGAGAGTSPNKRARR
ncbi:hypothetical protein V8E36_004128 [Tilletia maclaganii]